MRGNNLTRILRLIKYLSIRPESIPAYVKYSLLNKKEPLDVELPWISWEAIKFLESYQISKESDVLELGGGGSTLFFAKKGAKITCVENSTIWSEKIMAKLQERNLGNVELKVFPYKSNNTNGFLTSHYFEEINKKKYDIILVDNYDDETNIRSECFFEAERSIKPGGIILLDDSWRYLKVREQNSAKSFRTYKSIGPCRYGITTTDIYFY